VSREVPQASRWHSGQRWLHEGERGAREPARAASVHDARGTPRNVSSAASPCAWAWTHASKCWRVVVIPASIGSTRCTGAGPAPFFACVRGALSVLFVIGGSLVPASGDRLSWPTRFSRRPGSRRYSVLKFNRGRDIPTTTSNTATNIG